MKAHAEKEFDRYAGSYEADLETSIPDALAEGDYFAQYKIDILAARMSGRSQSTILDFGCGVGLSLSLLRERFPASEVRGYDVSSESLKLARERVGTVHLTDDLDTLPAAGFDIILAANVFHHIPPAERIDAFTRCHGLLRDGGRMFLFEHNPLNPVTRRVFERCSFDRDAEMIRRPEAIRLARSGGLVVVRADYTLFFPKQLSMLRPLERFLCRLPLGAQYCLELTPDTSARPI